MSDSRGSSAVEKLKTCDHCGEDLIIWERYSQDCLEQYVFTPRGEKYTDFFDMDSTTYRHRNYHCGHCDKPLSRRQLRIFKQIPWEGEE